jgi:DNA polymerase-3 subunit gamma/tau
MSYQVLARKWRPQTFSELVGQQHVVDAITNALENDKLHHAYLFTGTRGVGKTTIARIFSKSLNCERGQSANPCGVCDTCVDISDGRYVDLLEIDAASRTKVEDTRELLDNVQYRPTRGKYKVYLIDEVHMLSKHSFNALLKTLEEPPEHVKFLLATTDPQKLPVTVLSRCLQFSLKALTTEQIQTHLAYILGQEQIQYEKSAIAQLARAAQGSIRDSLSLTDQAIAQGNNQVTLAVVANMLGLLNKNHIVKLVKHICERDSATAMTQLDDICSQSPDYVQVLSQLLALLHQIALTQVVPEVCKLDTDSAKGIYTLAKSISKEHIQILYQIGVNGKRDLPHAPDARTGLQMTVLRMLAFSPAQTIDLDLESLVTTENSLPAFEALPEPPAPAPEPVKKATIIPAAVSSSAVVDNSSASSSDADNVQNHFLGSPETLVNSEHNIEKDVANDIAPVQTQDTIFHEPVHQQDSNTVNNDPLDKQDVSDKQEFNNDSQVGTASHVPSDDPHLPPSFHDEQPPLPDEEPPFYNDMFGADEFVDDAGNVEPNNYASTPAQEQTDAMPNNEQVQHKPSVTSASNNTYDLLKVSKELKEYTKEKEEDSGAKKSEADTQTAEAVTEEFTYQIGDTFAPFGGQVPAFLSSGDKVSSASQLDEWSEFVDATDIQALTRQLLINASCEELSNPLVLTLDHQNQHINEEPLVEKIQTTLSELMDEEIEVKIEFSDVQNTPFQIQTNINDMRMRYAHEMINTTESIQELIKAFDASVVEGSVEAR